MLYYQNITITEIMFLFLASDFFTKVSVKRSHQKKGKDVVEVSDESNDCLEAMQTPNGI